MRRGGCRARRLYAGHCIRRRRNLPRATGSPLARCGIGKDNVTPGFRDFDLDTTGVCLQPVASEIPLQYLREASRRLPDPPPGRSRRSKLRRPRRPSPQVSRTNGRCRFAVLLEDEKQVQKWFKPPPEKECASPGEPVQATTRSHKPKPGAAVLWCHNALANKGITSSTTSIKSPRRRNLWVTDTLQSGSEARRAQTAKAVWDSAASAFPS